MTDAETGLPISGADVVLPSLDLSTTTDTNGLYQFADLETLNFSVTASFAGYSSTSEDLDLAEHGSYTLNLALNPANEIPVE